MMKVSIERKEPYSPPRTKREPHALSPPMLPHIGFGYHSRTMTISPLLFNLMILEAAGLSPSSLREVHT